MQQQLLTAVERIVGHCDCDVEDWSGSYIVGLYNGTRIVNVWATIPETKIETVLTALAAIPSNAGLAALLTAL